ncbi:MAG: hypothetical protein RLZ98_640 [Pseudomonadota bacterium]
MIATIWDRQEPTVRRQLEDEERPLVGPRDARARIASTLILITAVLIVNDWRLLSGLILALALFARLTGLTFREQQKRLMHVEGFMLALLVLLPLTVPGTPISIWGPLAVSMQGLERAIGIALKVLATALVIHSLLGSLELVRLGRALAALGVPAKLVHLLLFSVRYIAVFRRETMRLREAMRARAFKPSSNLHTLATYGNLIGMLLVRSLERAERVDEAMRCRAFSGRFPLRSPKPLRLPDIAFVAALGTVALALVLLSRTV